jgi:hypothetical protein
MGLTSSKLKKDMIVIVTKDGKRTVKTLRTLSDENDMIRETMDILYEYKKSSEVAIKSLAEQKKADDSVIQAMQKQIHGISAICDQQRTQLAQFATVVKQYEERVAHDARVIADLSRQISRKLPPPPLFDHPTTLTFSSPRSLSPTSVLSPTSAMPTSTATRDATLSLSSPRMAKRDDDGNETSEPSHDRSRSCC